jgi:RNA polymerase sigma factor (TIGR02999 family)
VSPPAHRDPAAESRNEITTLLGRLESGDAQVMDRLVPLVYDELRRLAHHLMQDERADHTLSSTGLVHEAYLRLVDQRAAQWKNRGHFFAVASMAMRRILVNHAVAKTRAKRGGGAPVVSLDQGLEVLSEDRLEEIVAVDAALMRLEAIHPRASRVVDCRYFAGLSVAETAESLEVAERTVKRDWQFAKAWLRRELG